MNKILVNKNKIEDYRDDFIKIVDGNIYIYKDSEYEIEYIDSDNIIGEIFGVINAVDWAISNGYEKIKI